MLKAFAERLWPYACNPSNAKALDLVSSSFCKKKTDLTQMATFVAIKMCTEEDSIDWNENEKACKLWRFGRKVLSTTRETRVGTHGERPKANRDK